MKTPHLLLVLEVVKLQTCRLLDFAELMLYTFQDQQQVKGFHDFYVKTLQILNLSSHVCNDCALLVLELVTLQTCKLLDFAGL